MSQPKWTPERRRDQRARREAKDQNLTLLKSRKRYGPERGTYTLVGPNGPRIFESITDVERELEIKPRKR